MASNLPALRDDLSGELVIIPGLEKALEQAQVLIDSGLLPAAYDTPQKVVTVVLKGRELGLPPMIALEHIYPTGQGRTGIDGQVVEIMLRRAGHRWLVLERSDARCEIEFHLSTGEVYRTEVTREEVIQARWHQYWDRQNKKWKDKPTWVTMWATMQYWRCLAKGARQHAADALNNESVFFADDRRASPDDQIVVQNADGTLDLDRRANVERDNAPLLEVRPRGVFKQTSTPGDTGYKPGNGEAEAVNGDFIIPEEPPELREVPEVAPMPVVLPDMPEQVEPHWIDAPNVRDRFWAYAKSTLSLNEEQVYDALGVGAIHQYRGTAAQAKKALEQYAAKIRQAQEATEAAQEPMPL